MMTTASMMLLSLLLGATGTFAVVHQDPAPHRELHRQKAVIRLERVQARLEQHRVGLAEATMLFEQGVSDGAEAARQRRKIARAESEVRLRELDLAETRLTGRAPVDDLTAPLVVGEDFVSQRLIVRHEATALDLEHVLTEHRRIEMLVAEGVVSDAETESVRTERARVELALTRLQERLDLRRSFIGGEVTAADVEFRTLLRDAEALHAAAISRLGAAQRRLLRATALYENGMAPHGTLRAAQIEVRDAEADQALAEVEVRLIRQRLESLDTQD